jgi:glutamyl-tRNA reductase
VPLVCLGLSHNTAPVDVRERHAFPASRMAETLVALRDYEMVREAAMLSTCGRLEIYAELEDYEAGVEQLKSFLRNFRHGDVADMSSYMYTLLGSQATDHLFRVATGLDSMLIGEAEILGQVKDAYIQAQKARSLGKTLHALFREALKAGKEARSRTHIGGDSVSVATAAIDLAKQRLGSLGGKTVLILGAGKMGSLAAKRLRLEGCTELLIANRSHAKARDVADKLGPGATTVELPGLVAALGRADIVITSTGASHFVLGPGNVAEAMLGRPTRPLFIVDIAVPRDADPEVARIPNVDLADIDRLKDVVDTTLERRREAVPLVEEIIAEHGERFARWYQSRVAIPVVSSLVQKAEAIREAEIERLFARCPELSERERMLVTGASLTIISKLLHSVVTKLRERATSNRAEAMTLATLLDELFDLRVRSEELAAGRRSATPPALEADVSE